jgi:hypothetical protein
MKNRINDAQVRWRIPKGCELPTRFDDFVRAEPPFAVEWNSLDSYCLKRSATKEAVPFLHLPDGGLVAFWYHAESPAIVHIGAHGELQVIAHNFDDFLKGIGAKCSGLPDFDEADDVAFRVPGVKGKPNKKGLPALQQKFEQWFKKHTSLLEPLETPDTEALRLRVHQISEQMLRDGCSKVYTLSSHWWSMDFQIERTDAGLAITYLDYGKWYPVAKKYLLEQEVTALLQLVKHKNRGRYELSTCCAGIVSIDRDRELLLLPPERRD